MFITYKDCNVDLLFYCQVCYLSMEKMTIVKETFSLRTVCHKLRFKRKSVGMAWDMKCEHKTGGGCCSFNTIQLKLLLSESDRWWMELKVNRKKTSKISILLSKAKKEIIIIVSLFRFWLICIW